MALRLAEPAERQERASPQLVGGVVARPLPDQRIGLSQDLLVVATLVRLAQRIVVHGSGSGRCECEFMSSVISHDALRDRRSQ